MIWFTLEYCKHLTRNNDSSVIYNILFKLQELYFPQIIYGLPDLLNKKEYGKYCCQFNENIILTYFCKLIRKGCGPDPACAISPCHWKVPVFV